MQPDMTPMEASTLSNSSKDGLRCLNPPAFLGSQPLRMQRFPENVSSRLGSSLTPLKPLNAVLHAPSSKVKYHLFLCAQGSRCRWWFKKSPLAAGVSGSMIHLNDNTCTQKPGLYGRIVCGRTMISSLAEANEGHFSENYGEKDLTYYMDNMPVVLDENEQHVSEVKPGSNGGMAEAFNICSRTAFGITAAVAFSALLLPFTMKSVLTGVTMKIKILSYVTLLCGFYMAWNIGANAMGTSVGSGAVTLRQAVLIAAGLEFSGAFLVGSHVSHTMLKIYAISLSLANCGLWCQGKGCYY